MNRISRKLNQIKQNVKNQNSNDEIGFSNNLDNVHKIVSDDIFYEALSNNDIESKGEILSDPSQYSDEEVDHVENSDLNYFNTRTSNGDLIKDDILDVIDYIKDIDLA